MGIFRSPLSRSFFAPRSLDGSFWWCQLSPFGQSIACRRELHPPDGVKNRIFNLGRAASFAPQRVNRFWSALIVVFVRGPLPAQSRLTVVWTDHDAAVADA